MPTLKSNKRGTFDYTILEKFEAGIVLTGAEVKSAKLGQISLQGAFVSLHDGGAWLVNCHISAYKYAANPGYNPLRERKLLLRKQELARLVGQMHSAGLTVIPLSLYTATGLVKVSLGLARGKKKHDKRASIKKRETDRKIQKALKAR